MTLSPEELQAVFEKERAFGQAIQNAAKAAQPKPPGLLSSVAVFIAKSIPPNLISGAIERAGKDWMESRRTAKEAEQPQERQEPKQPPTARAAEQGRPKKDSRSGVTFVGTFVEPEKPVPKPE